METTEIVVIGYTAFNALYFDVSHLKCWTIEPYILNNKPIFKFTLISTAIGDTCTETFHAYIYDPWQLIQAIQYLENFSENLNLFYDEFYKKITLCDITAKKKELAQELWDIMMNSYPINTNSFINNDQNKNINEY